MKKVLAIILCAVMMMTLAVGFAGCGSKDVGPEGEPYLGDWTAKKAVYQGIEMSIQDILGKDFFFTLNKNGTADVTVGSEKEKAKWEPTEDGFKIIEGKDEFVMVDQGDGKFIWNYEGVDIYIVRYDPNAPEEPEEDKPYVGTWAATKAVYEGVEMDINEVLSKSFIFTLNNSGIADVTVGDESEKAIWEPVEGGFKIKEGEDEFIMLDQGDGTLIWNYEGIDIYIEKYDG